ncbi:pseudouridine-5'-phosphate glycosidase [Proteiniclasticum sp. QWL-01]|uniref:pseudouridine-5'-phosphate glycosidase n=1 Tax=Proteiniclasticum sp. QWL-01 TaxID=3036945 RepID=UPI00220D9786|nr:pseudouridine-5'-phosphate glycosidase [Proteiniclasticum sp. QWL-01]UUM12616.1 pseudouridine-5'-phosphate glycosidase [Clostridiaceae bacterium HFYG-1003]WFF74171.1 pseudouridine-5'-phosphate glycosidase [Proteiniclasticum sp. QWL-01]
MEKFVKYLELSPEVEAALKEGRPVVALESTIISHGMPYPANVDTARAVEQIVRDHGAVPATIAILNGKLKAGLTDEEIEYLGQATDVIKASRRDIPYIVAQGRNGGTTVGATMIVAALAGIKVFATGGIGGVHRGAETTMDISADLEELGKTDVIVVCAGAKAILDLGLTLEYLETRGVPVLGYQTASLPAFYTSTSEFKVDYRVDSAREIAAIAQTKWDLNLSGGVLVTNPIPAEYSMDPELINQAIENALDEAKVQGIQGKETTPFLLSRIKEITKGKSLDSNIQLVYNNAAVASDIAVELAKAE